MVRARSFELRVFLILILVSSLAVGFVSAQGRPLAIEDYYRIQSVGNPQISPDGHWVAFTVSTRIEEDNSTRVETSILPTDRSAEPRRVVHYGKDILDARWSDDNLLQYAADQGLWTLDPADPTALPARKAGGCERSILSPDGKWSALLRDKPRQIPEPTYASDFERRHQERFEGAIFDWKDFQRDGAEFPAPDPTARAAIEIVIQPVGGGDAKVLLSGDLRPTNVRWHPNGNLLAFTADSDWRNELSYGRADLYTVTTDGDITQLTDDLYVHSGGAFSPDGRYVSYARSYGTDLVIQEKLDHGGPRDLFVRPVEGGAPINLTANWDLQPGAARWAPDSGFMYFTAGIGGQTHLFRASVPDGNVEQVTRGERRLRGVSIDKNFRTMVYTVGLHESPPEIYASNPDGTNERRLTSLHDNILSEIAVSNTQRLEWGSYDGTRIEGWLTFPYGYNEATGPYPLIVFSHGGPHSAVGYSFNFKKQFFAANGYFVLDTNFRSSTGYGEAFKWATWGEWGNKDGQDVVSGVDYVLERYPIDPGRVGHTGHSYGGFLTNWVITQYPDHFAAAISGAGITNWVSDYGTADIYRTKETEFFGTPWEEEALERMIKQSPLTHAGNVKTPTLFVHGEVDQRVPYPEGEQMYFALKRQGVPAKMIRYAGQAHAIRGHWNNVHRMINELAWWSRYLEGQADKSSSGGGN